MLVLSRRPNEKIVFPNLGITIEVLRVSGKAVSVGVDAPRNIRILREELPAHGADEPPAVDDTLRELRHALRNCLHAANLALHLAQRQLQIGRTVDAESTLTKALEELSKLDQVVSRSRGESDAQVEGSPRRALLVEDDVNECELLAGYLRISGYEVSTVGNGQEAMQFLSKQTPPDVVLLDMHMPLLDGPGTVAAIRRRPELKSIKLFAVSGTPRSELSVGLGPSGVDRWFAKPLNPARLVDAMNRDLAMNRVLA